MWKCSYPFVLLLVQVYDTNMVLYTSVYACESVTMPDFAFFTLKAQIHWMLSFVHGSIYILCEKFGGNIELFDLFEV